MTKPNPMLVRMASISGRDTSLDHVAMTVLPGVLTAICRAAATK